MKTALLSLLTIAAAIAQAQTGRIEGVEYRDQFAGDGRGAALSCLY